MMTLRSASLPFRRPSLDPTYVSFRATSCSRPHLGHVSAHAGEAGEAKGSDTPLPLPLPLPRLQHRKENGTDAPAAAENPEPMTGWGSLTDSVEDWPEEQGKQAGGRQQRQIQEPAVSGVVLLFALIVGLSAAAWEISRFLVGFQNQRQAARPEVTVTVLPEKPSSTSAAAIKIQNSKRAAAAKKSAENLSGGRHSTSPGTAAATPKGGDSEQSSKLDTATGRKEQDSQASSHLAAQKQETENSGPEAGVGNGADLKRGSSSMPGPDVPAKAEQQAAKEEQAAERSQAASRANGLDAKAAPAPAEAPGSSGSAAGEGPAKRSPSDASASPEAPPPSPKSSQEGGGGGAAGWPAFGLPGQNAASRGMPSAEAKGTSSPTPGNGQLHEKQVWRSAQPAAEKSAATTSTTGGREAWSGAPKPVPGELGSSLQQSAEALAVRAPSANAADALPPGRGLPALRERAQLALRAAAAASEASQRAAAYSAAASAAASQAADAAEGAAAAATDAQAALENEAEGAIVAAEERAQRAAGLARDAEGRAAHSASSAVAYQNLAQVQASVAGKAAKMLAGAGSGGNGGSSAGAAAKHLDWMSSGDLSEDAAPVGVIKALQDAWEFLVLKSRGGGGGDEGGGRASDAAAGPSTGQNSVDFLGSGGNGIGRQRSGRGQGSEAQPSSASRTTQGSSSSSSSGSFSAGSREARDTQDQAQGQAADAAPSAGQAGSLPGLAQSAFMGITSGIKTLWGKVLNVGGSQGGP